MTLLPQCMPNVTGIGLPEQGDLLCMTFGYQLHKPCDDALRSDDPAVVAAYVARHFKAYPIPPEDLREFAQQWCRQSWSTTGQVHCNLYHSTKLQCVILGDAAHATSPSIGMGMNTALGDASALNRLLDTHGDDNLEAVLTAFSEERVKEGQALSDLAFYLFPFSPTLQVWSLLAAGVRTFLHRWVPRLVDPEPQNAIGYGWKLSAVYELAKRQGLLERGRANNDRVRREYWERRWGMVTAPARGGACAWGRRAAGWSLAALATAACAAYARGGAHAGGAAW